MDPSIQTAYGSRLFNLRFPHPSDVDIKDIAHALSNLCRFSGHTREFYSVAQHCCLAAGHFVSPLNKLHALLHDAHEAYTGDISSPMCEMLTGLRMVKHNAQRVIYESLGLDLPSEELIKSIKEVDERLLFTERRDLLSGLVDWDWDRKPYEQHIYSWSSETARCVFLSRYKQLMLGCGP